MDPMSRKMFKSRDARNTLRGMGGIMASSPELSQTVQQFQEGGAVHAPSGKPYADMSRMQLQILASTGDAIALNTLREGVSVAAQPDASSIQRFPPAPADLRADAKADIAEGGTGAVRGAVHAPSGMPYADMSRMHLQALANTGDAIALNMLREEVSVAAQPDASPIQRFPSAPADLRDDAKAERSFGRSAYMSGLQTPSDLRPMFSARAETPLSEMSPERLEAERMATESGGVKELGIDIAEVVTGAVRGAGESLQQGLGSGLSIMGMPGAGAFFLEGAKDTAAISAQRAREERAREAVRAARVEEINEAAGVTRGEPLTVPKGGAAALLPPAPADETVETTVPEDETPVLTPTADTGAGTAAPEIDFDASYAQAKERLGAIMGGEADDDKKNKAMANLAMIGLAIASGKSPNALTNIAQGALAGMQGISKAEAAEKAQEREIELAAIKMAADESDLNKRLASAEKIAAMRTAGGSGTFSPQDRLYNSVFTEMLQQTGDVEEASAAARQAAPGASQAAMSAVAGQIVEQNGIRYQRQADGSFKQLG